VGRLAAAAVLVVALLAIPARAASCIQGGDLQNALNQRGRGASVCLSGTFTGTIRPLQGQTITGGELRGSFDLRAGNVTLHRVEVYGGGQCVIVGNRSTVDASYIHDCAENAIHGFAGGADWFVRITDNRIVDNGTRSLEGHSSAALKLLALSKPNHRMGAGATITGDLVTGSVGNGLWLDQSSNASVLAQNTIRNSTRHGIRCEICGGDVIIRDNTISGSGFDGIDVTSTGVAEVLGNTVTGSHDWGITIHMDPRAKKWWANLGDPHVGWHLHSITVKGNTADRTNGCNLAAVRC